MFIDQMNLNKKESVFLSELEPRNLRFYIFTF